MNARQQLCHLATCPQVIASVELQHAAMDETMEHVSPKAQWRAAGLAQTADAAAIEDMRFELRRLFLRAMQFANAPSTPKVPTTFRVNVAEEGERDRFEQRVVMEPVTVVAYQMLETKGGADEHLHLLIARPEDVLAQRDAQLQALASEYADAEAAALVEAGWEA